MLSFSSLSAAVVSLPSWVWQQIIDWCNGYTMDHKKVALQVFLAYAILIAIMAPEESWNQLAHGAVVPPLALVFLILIGPYTQGVTIWSILQSITGILTGGCLILLSTYLTNAAIGFNWGDNSVTKGVVMTIFSTLAAFVLMSAKFFFKFTFEFTVTACASLVFAGGISSYYRNPVDYLQVFYALQMAVLGLGTMAIISSFVFPVTSGSLYRGLLANSIRKVATAIEALGELMLSPVNSETGVLSAATGKINLSTGSDEGLQPMVDKIKDPARVARGLLLGSWNFHMPVLLEIDIYNRPRLFPRFKFINLRICISLLIASLAPFGRPLRTGRTNLRLLQNSQVKEKLTAVFSFMVELLKTLADCLESTTKFVEADGLMEKLDATWLEFIDAAAESVDGNTTPDAVFAVQLLATFLYITGSRCRAIYAVIAGAIKARDPEAETLAIKRLETTPWWVKPAAAFKNPLHSNEAALTAIQREAESVDQSIRVNFGSLRTMPRFGPFADIVKAQALPKSAADRTRRVWNMPTWIIFGFQFAFAMAVATALCVVPVIAEKGFHNRPMDIALTVAVTWSVSDFMHLYLLFFWWWGGEII